MRFTQSSDGTAVYAIVLTPLRNSTTRVSFSDTSLFAGVMLREVQLMTVDAPVTFVHIGSGLIVFLDVVGDTVMEHAFVLKIV